MIDSVLIANRGEIAVRVARSCRALGLRSVAVFSEADRRAAHVAAADEAILIGPAPAAESYLDGEQIVAAARRAGVDAIHPGYGFLAENAAFATACAAAGFTFVGPSPEAIAAMGDKRAARRRMAAAGIPVIPGYDGDDQTDEALTSAAKAIGWPIMVKAAAGGGGKGMRKVAGPEALPAALATARREARQAFGDDTLILERALERPRHVEVQVAGDRHGRLIHLGERDCSLQRRHQKIVEEAPAPGLDAALRRALGETAVAVGQAIAYDNLGTVEFLLTADGRFYFLEMNTRIQVEHPVTEMVTGFDLVAWQIDIAAGAPLPISQEAVSWTGHAVEARIYAEDAAAGFLPATGPVLRWTPPDGDGLRVDAGVRVGDDVAVYYDPLLAKIVAHGPDRATAVRRLRRAVAQTTLLGLTSNLDFLQALLAGEAFARGDVHTGLVEEAFSDWTGSGDVELALLAVSVAQFERDRRAGGHWRNSPNGPVTFHYDAQPSVALAPWGRGYRLVVGDGSTREVVADGAGAWLSVDGYRRPVVIVNDGDIWWAQTPTGVVRLQARPRLPRPRPAADAAGSLRAPMPGVVLDILVTVGDEVDAGQPLLKLEAMKMEHTIRSAAPGVVRAIHYQAGDQVEADALLLAVETAAD